MTSPRPSASAEPLLRVAFNATPLVAPQLRGWTRYAVNLLAALPGQGVWPILLARSSLQAAYLDRLPAGSFEVRVAPPMSYLRWEQVWVPRACRAAAAAIYHCPINFGVPLVGSVPRVLTLHDAIGPGRSLPWSDPTNRALWADWAYHLIARSAAERVITVSDSARGELVDRLRVRPDRVTVIPEAADSIFHGPVTAHAREAARLKWGLARPYLFYVGGWDERKNLPFLLRAFAAAEQPELDLVLAGGRSEERPDLVRLATELRIADRLRLLSFVPDAELPALFSAALGFVYPSRREGFGLQLVEAMTVGCPVLAARATSLPEVLGSGGVTFALDGPAELIGLIQCLATDSDYRADLTNRARQRATAFSWDRTAALTARLYRATMRRHNR